MTVPEPERPLTRQRVFKLLRYLRIAISSFFAVLCLLIIAWWVRSYSWSDGAFLRLTSSEYVQVSAGYGRMCIWFEHKQTLNYRFKHHSHRITTHTPPDADDRIPLFHVGYWPTMTRVYAAHWVFVVLAGSFAVIPWCPRRFSLRFLLISTTVIAAVVSVIAWVDNSF